MNNEKPRVVKIHDVKVDREYKQWLRDIKSRYRNAQIKAALKVNAEQLLFNWQLGRDLVERKAVEKWGTGVVEQLSLDLQAAFPESKGFSTTNLWRMKQWYLFYSTEREKLPQLVGELQLSGTQSIIKLPQHVTELGILAYVPWGHHAEILAKCKTLDEAVFYLSRTITENWSRNTLMNCIKADLYHTSGGAISTFAKTLPSPRNELVQAITKDAYDFGFPDTLSSGIREGFCLSGPPAASDCWREDPQTGYAFLPHSPELLCRHRAENRPLRARIRREAELLRQYRRRPNQAAEPQSHHWAAYLQQQRRHRCPIFLQRPPDPDRRLHLQQCPTERDSGTIPFC